MSEDQPTPLLKTLTALILGWIVPGLGHLFLKHRTRGLIFLITITATFWTGVAVGGMRSTVNPDERKLWFAAQLGSGGHALLAWAGHELSKREGKSDPAKTPPALAHWRSVDVAIHYTGVAGLLNVLVLFDILARAENRKKAAVGIVPAQRGDST